MKTYIFSLILGVVLLGAGISANAQSAEPVRTSGLNTFGPTVPSRIRSNRDSTLPPYKYNIALLPLSFLGQGLELAGEVMVQRKTSLRLTAGYYLGTQPWFYENSEKYSGFRGELQLRFFTQDIQQRRQSMYMGPFLQVKHIDLERTVEFPNSNLTGLKKYSVTSPSFGVLVGWQLVSQSGFMLDIFMGGGLIIANNNDAAKEVHIPVVNPYTQGVMLRSGVGIGIGR